jgi:hypothetical protein
MVATERIAVSTAGFTRI